MIKKGKSRLGLLYAGALAVVLLVFGAFIHGSRRVDGEYQAPMTAFSGGTFEASGVVQVPGTDGVLFVDDDHTEEVFFMRIGEDRKQAGPIIPIKISASIIDPEGITTDGQQFYVVGSQSQPPGGDLTGLARFRFDVKNQRAVETQSIAGLKSFLANNVDELRGMQNKSYGDGGINVEGIAWDPKGARLLLGLRSPVVDRQALVVPLKLRDPQGPFSLENMEVEGRKAIRLPFNGAGIRSIEYDDLRKTFRLITGAPGSEKMDSKLWEWTGSPDPTAVRETDTYDRRLHAEGIARVTTGDRSFTFIVFDTSGYAAKD
jgi:hypothetical protein